MNIRESGVLRRAQRADRDDIRRWRNHPQVRAASFTGHEISANEHEKWFERVLADPTRELLIYSDDGVPAGVVLFERVRAEAGERTASWGFYLDLAGLEERGTGLSAWLGVQRAALDHAFDTLDLDVLTGEVLEHNTVVRRANRRFGFVEGPPAERVVDGRTVAYREITLRRADRRGAARPVPGGGTAGTSSDATRTGTAQTSEEPA